MLNFLEVIIIDSNSTDDTLKIAKEYPVKIIRVDPEKFRHGKIRNLGANLAKGSYLVFLTQDAIPSNINWLKKLTEPFSDPNIAGIYGRQIPKKDANITDKVFYISMYPDKSFLLSGPRKDKVDAIFSNVNSAIKKGYPS